MLEKYITETTNSHREKYNWELWAESFEDAEKIAERREIGETVKGKIPHDCKDYEWERDLANIPLS